MSAVAQLTLQALDGSQTAVLVEQGTGRQDRRGYRSADAGARLRACVIQRPRGGPEDAACWHQQRPSQTLSVKAIQKTLARSATAAGIVASSRWQQTLASN